jgi:nicotinamidase-related amidase
MPLSQLEKNAALVVIDLQHGIVALPTVHPSADIVAKCAALARAFRAKNHPVVLVNVVEAAPGRTDAPKHPFPTDPRFAELVPELEAAPSDMRVSKQRWGAFQTTDLDAQLRAKGITQIVLVGIATSIGIESTARYASELGYDVVLVTDAMTDLVASAHENSIRTIFPRIGETTSTDELLKAVG